MAAIRYIGTQIRWPELAVTGRQSVWFPGQIEDRPPAEESALLATGLFARVAVPAAAITDASGAITGLVRPDGGVHLLPPAGSDADGPIFYPENYGATGGTGTDQAEAIMACWTAAAAAYNPTTGVRARVVFTRERYGVSGLALPVGGRVILDFGKSKIIKIEPGGPANPNPSPTKNSILRTFDVLTSGSYYGRYDDIDIIGGEFYSNGMDCPAQILRLENVRRMRIVGTKVFHSAGVQRWAIQIGGHDITVSGDWGVYGGDDLFQDGLHLTHGNNILVIGGHVESGDDAIACGIDSGSATETWDDEGLTNVRVFGTYVRSVDGTIKVYYGLNTATGQPFAGTKRGTVDGVTMVGIHGRLGIERNGAIYITDTTALALAGSVLTGATSATLASAYTGATGVYDVQFSNADRRQATLTNGSTSVTWTFGLSSGASGSMLAVNRDRLRNIQILGFDLEAGSASNDGFASHGIYVFGARNVRLQGQLRVVGTENGTRTRVGEIIFGTRVQLDLGEVTVPSGGGINFRECRRALVANTTFRGGTNVIQWFGADVRVVDNNFIDLPANGVAMSVASVGAGLIPNRVWARGNVFNKATGATTTRALTTSSTPASVIFVDNSRFSETGIANNVDDYFNSSGFAPTEFVCRGNLGLADTVQNGPVSQGFGDFSPAMNRFGRYDVAALTSGILIGAPTGGQRGQRLVFTFQQDGSGSRAITWNAAYKGVTLAASGSANQRARIEFECVDGTNFVQVSSSGWYS